MAEIKYKSFNDIKKITSSQAYELLDSVEGLLECAENINFYMDEFDESDYIFMKNRIRHIMEILEEEEKCGEQ